MPRCQERNNSRRRRGSRPSLEIVVPVTCLFSNAKNPDGAGNGLYRDQLSLCHGRATVTGLVPAIRLFNDAGMRPLVLSPLFATLTSLPGVGPKLEQLYARLLGREQPRVIDLLLHLPSGAIDRRARPKLDEVQTGQVVTVSVQVEEHRPSPRNRPRAP